MLVTRNRSFRVRDHTASETPSRVTSIAASMAVKYDFAPVKNAVTSADVGRRVDELMGEPVAGQYSRPRPDAPAVAVRSDTTQADWKLLGALDVPGVGVPLIPSACASRIPFTSRASTRHPCTLTPLVIWAVRPAGTVMRAIASAIVFACEADTGAPKSPPMLHTGLMLHSSPEGIAPMIDTLSRSAMFVLFSFSRARHPMSS